MKSSFRKYVSLENFEHETNFDLHIFFLSIFHFKSFRSFFMFHPHTRQAQMCFISELWGSLSPIIQSKMEWIGELSTNMKSSFFGGKPRMTLENYSEKTQMSWFLLGAGSRPVNLSLWLWRALPQSALSMALCKWW